MTQKDLYNEVKSAYGTFFKKLRNITERLECEYTVANAIENLYSTAHDMLADIEVEALEIDKSLQDNSPEYESQTNHDRGLISGGI